MRLIVAITGASGVVYGKRLLETLRDKKVETHLVISLTAERIIEHELGVAKKALGSLANHTYELNDWNSAIASGSFRTGGMVIAPCSMKTLAGVANGYSDNLILRAADVTLKEKRRLILVPRETPLNVIHLKNMLDLAKQGVLIVPAMPAYYHKPKNIEDMVNYVVGRVLDLLEIEHTLYKGWGEIKTK